MRAPEADLNFIVKNEKTQEFDLEEVVNKKDFSTNEKFYHKFIIPNLIFFIFLHIGAIIGIYKIIFEAKIITTLWTIFIGFWTGEAIALGAHRYYSHRSFKVTTPLRVGLILFQLMAGQNSMYTWARDHRLHHKYSDTDADPHNASRGFLFSHIGWIVTKKHPLVKQKVKCVDVSDLQEDRIVMFQHKYFVPLYLTLGFFLPTYLPVWLWGEDWWISFWVAYCFRYATILNLTWMVNSLAHIWGTKPYDKRIGAMDTNLVANLTGGDGWHNYHHSFPWDSRAGEFSKRGGFNTKLLTLFASYGLAYDLKTASDVVVEGHVKRHGDGTRPTLDKNTEEEEEEEKKIGERRNVKGIKKL